MLKLLSIINEVMNMINTINRFFVFTLILLSGSSLAKIEDFETTRLKSAAGAGVATLLINESSVLNPASIVFFNKSTLYYQKDSISLEDKSSNRTKNLDDTLTEALIITDTSSPLKGGFSYIYQNNFSGKKTTYSTSMSKAISKDTALGVILKYIDEDSDIVDKQYWQSVIGLTHIKSEDLSFGLVINDPAQKQKEYFKYTLGLQYRLNGFMQLAVDIGSGDMANHEKESFTKWNFQLQTFSNIFIRYGQLYDKYANHSGIGYGLSWVGPRLALDIAYKNVEIIDLNTDMFYEDESFSETSLALTVLF